MLHVTEELPVLQLCVTSLLFKCCELGTVDTDKLSAELCLSRYTVATYFKRTNSALGTHSRFEAVQKALRLGLFIVPPLA